MENNNFILPKTESTINSIIEEATRFFDIARISTTAIYLVYLALRAVLFTHNVWFDATLIALYTIQIVFLILEILKKFQFQKIELTLTITKRLGSLVMIALAMYDLYITQKILPWQIVMCILMLLGFFVILAGDIFQFTIPRYSQMLLASFKNDIEIGGLVSRGMSELKNAAKDAINTNEVKTAAKAGGIAIAVGLLGWLGQKVLRR